MTEDVDSEAPRPEEHYQIAQGAEWHYVTDDFAETISLGPATDGEPGDDWALSFTPEDGIGSQDQLS